MEDKIEGYWGKVADGSALDLNKTSTLWQLIQDCTKFGVHHCWVHVKVIPFT